ncbi:MAG: hypothetical protein ACHQ17_03945, partial [Polyangia bacterium]
MRRASFFAGALVALLSATAGAEPVVLRMGTVAPEGTSWARELKAVSRDEAAYVMGAIHETIESEAQRAGFAVLITTGLGPEVIFTRAP